MEWEVSVYKGNTLVLMSLLCYAFAYIFNQRFSQEIVQSPVSSSEESLNRYLEKNFMPWTQ